MAGIKNATDQVYKAEGQEFRSVGNIQTAYYGYPKTYMLSAEFKYWDILDRWHPGPDASGNGVCGVRLCQPDQANEQRAGAG
jgi:hypothetical protein